MAVDNLELIWCVLRWSDDGDRPLHSTGHLYTSLAEPRPMRGRPGLLPMTRLASTSRTSCSTLSKDEGDGIRSAYVSSLSARSRCRQHATAFCR
jgi:hypothetical protein